ncbi:MAG: DNA recombination protein RmuC [Stellaceae bacterium]
MEIALIAVVVVLLSALVIAAGALARYYLRAREEAARADAELNALRRGLESEESRRRENLDAVRDAARAASLEAAQSMSSKLLDDHKRETEAAQKASVEQTRETSGALVKQLQGLADTVAGLHAQLKEKGETVDMLKRVLENPGSAGAMNEIVLDNTLKSFGLEQPRDYVVQYSASDDEGKRLRPDAVVFLPGDNLLVIDCKASKFLLEIAQAEGTDGEQAAYANFGRTMNQHLKALCDKDYRSAVLSERRRAGRDGAPAQIYMMMFLPNEAAKEKLMRAEPMFRDRARAADIIVGSVDELHSVLSVVSTQITLARQIENHEKIIDRTRLLLDGIAVSLGKAADVGKNLRRAAESFDDFGRSVNRSLLPRARTMVTLGVQSNKPLPGPMPAFSVHTEDNVIEGEAEELPLPPAPPSLVK